MHGTTVKRKLLHVVWLKFDISEKYAGCIFSPDNKQNTLLQKDCNVSYSLALFLSV